MFQFKAKIDGKWVQFDFDDVYGGKITVDGLDRDLPSVELVDVRLFSGKHDAKKNPIYFGDTVQPKYNNLGECVVTYDNVTRHDLSRCEVVNDEDC